MLPAWKVEPPVLIGRNRITIYQLQRGVCHFRSATSRPTPTAATPRRGPRRGARTTSAWSIRAGALTGMTNMTEIDLYYLQSITAAVAGDPPPCTEILVDNIDWLASLIVHGEKALTGCGGCSE